MDKEIDIINFDNIYSYQSFYKNYKTNLINLDKIKNTNYYCEDYSVNKIYNILKKKKRNKISFLGSGNHHYTTYIILKMIKKPFTLIVFDNHTDMKESVFGDILSCGSWVNKSIENIDNLEEVILLGVNKTYENLKPDKIEKIKKVKIINNENINNVDYVNSFLKKEVSKKNIYISIDKDVLSSKYAMTNWDQGSMSIDSLLNILRYLNSNFNILGIDVCGEYCKDITNENKYMYRKANKLNNYCNLLILESFLKN